MERIRERDLEAVIQRINELTGNPLEYSTKDDQGCFHSNIGHYHLSHAYGRVALEQTMTPGGGVRRVLGSGTKRELYNELHAFIGGLSARQ